MRHEFASIAIDIGHSSVKTAIAIPGKTTSEITSQFDTVVQDWKQLRNPGTAKEAERDTVEVNDKKFFIGKTASLQSRAGDFTGQDREWIKTEQHDALLVGAWESAIRTLTIHDCLYPLKISLALGLPSAHFYAQKDILRNRALKLLSSRLAPNQVLDVSIQSQSDAPLLGLAIDSDGAETGKVGEDESWGVVEIGHFTTDFTFRDHGQEIDDASTSVDGVINVYQRVKEGLKQKGYLHDLDNQNRAIQKKSIKVYGNEVPVEDIVDPAIADFTTLILSRTNNLFRDSSQKMRGIILAGGGAEIPEIYKSIQAQYPNAVVAENPRFAVAIGMCRFAMLMGCK